MNFQLPILFFVIGLIHDVNGHGRLRQPPSRATMWRYGFGTPHNYNDNEGYCGGREYQMNQGGKCGICGDPYGDNPRQHEAPGGKYATGTIAATYESGSIIDVTVGITANHKGYFEFRLCPNNNVNQDPGQSCFDNNPLQIVNGDGTKYYIGTAATNYTAKVRLPQGLTCSQCIFQWEYTTGNHWGTDPVTGQGGMGVNPLEQEHFMACADIAITGNGGNSPNPPPSTSTPQPSTTTWAPAPTTTMTSPPSPNGGDCQAVGAYAGNQAMDQWCNANCNHVPPYCPANYCACGASGGKTCRAVSPWSKYQVFNNWCDERCNGNPPYCPSSYCTCN